MEEEALQSARWTLGEEEAPAFEVAVRSCLDGAELTPDQLQLLATAFSLVGRKHGTSIMMLVLVTFVSPATIQQIDPLPQAVVDRLETGTATAEDVRAALMNGMFLSGLYVATAPGQPEPAELPEACPRCGGGGCSLAAAVGYTGPLFVIRRAQVEALTADHNTRNYGTDGVPADYDFGDQAVFQD